MILARASMSRRYVYKPRWTARQLSDAMHALDLTSGMLGKISGANIDRVNRWLKGEDIPPYIQRDLTIWQQDRQGLEFAMRWADEHAFDVRSDGDE